jgi:hypothetical protein
LRDELSRCSTKKQKGRRKRQPFKVVSECVCDREENKSD